MLVLAQEGQQEIVMDYILASPYTSSLPLGQAPSFSVFPHVLLCCTDMAPHALKALQQAVHDATLIDSVRDQAAAGPALRLSGDTWSRLPYPLMSRFSGVVALRGKTAFTCTQVETGRRVFVKFTQRDYPVEVGCLTALRICLLLL